MDVASSSRQVLFQNPQISTRHDVNVEKMVYHLVQSNGGHPHIVECLATFQEFGYDHFVMEYCPLKLIDTIPTGETRMLELFMQIVDAVKFLHRHGVAHGAIHIRHVLVKDSMAKLIDFALASHLNVSSMKRDVTSLGRLLYYMATGASLQSWRDLAKLNTRSCFVHELIQSLCFNRVTLENVTIAIQTKSTQHLKRLIPSNAIDYTEDSE